LLEIPVFPRAHQQSGSIFTIADPESVFCSVSGFCGCRHWQCLFLYLSAAANRLDDLHFVPGGEAEIPMFAFRYDFPVDLEGKPTPAEPEGPDQLLRRDPF
jgi:hypothetical protein